MYKNENLKHQTDIDTPLIRYIMTKAIKQFAAAALLITFILGASAPVRAKKTARSLGPKLRQCPAITANSLKLFDFIASTT